MNFEWDEPKRQTNLEKHGFDFIDANRLFDGPHYVAEARTVGGERRWLATGMIGNSPRQRFTYGEGPISGSSHYGAHAMAKKQDIRRYSREELEAARARGESQTDWARVSAKTDAELARDIASDPDWRDIPADWYNSATLVMPAAKQLLSLRLDADVVAWFRDQGPGYQTRINAVLRAFVNQQTKPPPAR